MTGREIAHYFFDKDVRMDWDSKRLFIMFVVNQLCGALINKLLLLVIDCDEKDGGCTFYQNASRSEIVSKSKLTFFVGVFLGIFFQSFSLDARDAFW